jgi:hypothetical protein
MPDDIASGLTYLGQAIASRIAQGRLAKSEKAYGDAANSAWGDLTTVPELESLFGSSSQPGPTNEAASRKQEWPAGFDAQMPRDNLSYGPAMSMQGVPDDLRPMATDTTGKFQFNPAQGVSTAGMEPLLAGVVETAAAIGADPEDLLTVMLYETAGSLDPMQPGPTTQWGRHRGLIQFGEPQAKEYGVDFSSPDAALASQLGANGAVARYFQSRGYKPGMSFADLYSTVNAGAPGLLGRTDENNGGAPGTVADKVAGADMAAYRERARAMLGQGVTMSTKDSPEVLRGTPPGADFSSVGDVRAPDTSLSWANEKERDELILRLVQEGKVNPLLTQFSPVSLTSNLPQGVAGIEFDVGMMPVTIDTPNGPMVVPASANLAGNLASQLGGALPTRAIIEAMAAQGVTPFTPQTPGPGMTGVDAARRQSAAVFGATGQPQAPVVGPFKELLADGAFMGAYKADGTPYQPYTPGMGPHSGDYGDYSHGARMVGETARIRMADGTVREIPVSQLYADPAYSAALGLSGPVQPTQRPAALQGAGDTQMQGNPGNDRMGAVSYSRNPNPVDIMPMAGAVQMPPQGPVQAPPQPRTQPANWFDDTDPQQSDMALVRKLMDYQRQYGPAMSDYQKMMVETLIKRELSQPGAPGYSAPQPELKFIDGVGFVDMNNVPPGLMAGQFQPDAGKRDTQFVEGIGLIDKQTGEVISTYDIDQPGFDVDLANTYRDDLMKDPYFENGRLVQDGYGTLMAFYDNPGAVSDYGLAVAFAKIVDPGSVAREGEVAAVQSAPGPVAQVRAQIIKVLEGNGSFTPEVRAEIALLASQMFNEKAGRANTALDTYRMRADRQGIPFDEIFSGSPFSPVSEEQIEALRQIKGTPSADTGAPSGAPSGADASPDQPPAAPAIPSWGERPDGYRQAWIESQELQMRQHAGMAQILADLRKAKPETQALFWQQRYEKMRAEGEIIQ